MSQASGHLVFSSLYMHLFIPLRVMYVRVAYLVILYIHLSSKYFVSYSDLTRVCSIYLLLPTVFDLASL